MMGRKQVGFALVLGALFAGSVSAQGNPMFLLGVAGQERTAATTAAPGSWQHSREYTKDEGNDGGPVLTVVRVAWNDRAEDGIEVTVTAQPGAGYRITQVEYFLSKYDAADTKVESSSTVTDAGSSYRHHITLPNSAGKRFVDPPDAQLGHEGYSLSVHAALKSTKWGIDLQSALGVKNSAKFFNLPLLQ